MRRKVTHGDLPNCQRGGGGGGGGGDAGAAGEGRSVGVNCSSQLPVEFTHLQSFLSYLFSERFYYARSGDELLCLEQETACGSSWQLNTRINLYF